MSESALYSAILTEYSRGATRLMRINAGMAYQGRVIERTPGRLILAPWYPIRLAPEGVSDLIGWTTIRVHDQGEGGMTETIAQFLAIEGKMGRKQPTTEQTAFLDLVRRAGGRAGVARSVEDAGNIIRGES
jgi:hypothetical protein